MQEKQYYVYILASKKYGTLYVGITSNLQKRVHEHKTSEIIGFTQCYQVYKLVYFEIHIDPLAAISREKLIKRWKREWKISLIEDDNPEWLDLSSSLAG